MESFMNVCKINGIYYPIIHDDFFDISLPLQTCEICSKPICAKCLDPFNIVHECKYKYFIVSHEKYICTPCDIEQDKAKQKDLKERLKRAINRAKNKNL